VSSPTRIHTLHLLTFCSLPAGPGPRAVNAHDLISKVNQSDADCLFLLDCFFPDQTIKHWKRKDHMTEIIIAGAEMRDSNNGRTNTGAQSFAEGFFDGMRQIRAAPGRLLRPSIPMIMLHKTSLCSKPIRYWLNTPNRKRPDRRVWRFFIDIRRLKMGDGDKLQVRRCEVTGRRRGEFGGDPALENDGWGSDHESDDGGSDGGGDGGGDGDSDGGSDNEARHEGGGNDGEEDGDSSNGGWGRGFRRTRRRTPSRRQNAEDDDGAGVEDEDKGSGNGNGNADSVAKLYARIKRKLGLPSKLTDGEAINLFKRLDGLPKHLERRERLGDQTQQQLPTPSSGGIRKRARGKRAVSTEAGERGRSGVAARLRRASPVTSDCEITSVRRFGHESENPIDLSEATETVEGSAPASARRVRVTNWIQDLFKEEYDDDDKPFIKLSDSPVPRAGGDGAGAALRETLMDLDFEITSEGPVNRAFGRGALIDLTGTAIDLTNDSE
jgi:hypothetical protein